MPAHDPAHRAATATLSALTRHRGPDDPAVTQARHALDLARTEATIARAIQDAPPLDAATLDRLRALLGGEQG